MEVIEVNVTDGRPDRVMVTGAAGFIGSHLAEALMDYGHSVIGIDRCGVGAARNLDALLADPRFRYIAMDACGREMPELLDGVKVVFHLAAATGVRSSWGRRFAGYVASNVLATQRMLEFCATAGVPRMVIASSSSVYGELAGQPTREEDMTIPVSPYGVTKLAGEQLALAYASRAGAPTSVVALRYFTVYGPRQRADMAIARMFGAVLTGIPMRLYGDGGQRRSFTYVDDVVAATVQAARLNAQAEVINVAGTTCTPLAEVLELVAEITGRVVPVLGRGPHPGDVFATEGDITKATRLLGYQPQVGLADGLRRQWRWLESQQQPETVIAGRA